MAFEYYKPGPNNLAESYRGLGEASARRSQAVGTALSPLLQVLTEQMHENRADERQRYGLDHERALKLLLTEHDDAMQQERDRREHEARRSDIALEGENRLMIQDMESRRQEQAAAARAAAERAEEQRKNQALAGGLEAALRMKGSKDSGIYEEHTFRLADADPSMQGMTDDEILKRAQATRSPDAAKEFAKAMTKTQKAKIVNPDRFQEAQAEVARVYGKEGMESFAGAFKDEPRSVLELLGRSIDKLGGDTVRRDLPARTANEQGTPKEFGQEFGTQLDPQKVTGTNTENAAMRAPADPALASMDLLSQAGLDVQSLGLPPEIAKSAIDGGRIGIQPILENPQDRASRIKGFDIVAPARTDPGLVQKLQAWADSDLGKRGLAAAMLSKGTKGGLRPEQVEGRLLLGEPQRQAPAVAPAQPLVPTPTPAPASGAKKVDDMNDVRKFLDSWGG